MSILTMEYEDTNLNAVTMNSIGSNYAGRVTDGPYNLGKPAGPKGDFNHGWMGACFQLAIAVDTGGTGPTSVTIVVQGRADGTNADELGLPHPHQIHTSALNSVEADPTEGVGYAFLFTPSSAFASPSTSHITFNVETENVGWEMYLAAYYTGGDRTVSVSGYYKRWFWQLHGV